MIKLPCFPTVLLVKPECGERDLLIRKLHAQGYLVLVAEDAAQALDAVRIHSRPIHVMLIDEGQAGQSLASLVKPYRRTMDVLYMPDGPGEEKVPEQVLSRIGKALGTPKTATAVKVAAAGAG
jgi:DNA-binding NtrC family response regulator